MSLYEVSVHEAALTEMNHFNKAFRNAYVNPPWKTSKIIQHQRWNPYTMEGGYVTFDFEPRIHIFLF